MFKKKKTYIDKIDFDVFEDDKPDDFDLFSKEQSYDDESDYEDSDGVREVKKDESYDSEKDLSDIGADEDADKPEDVKADEDDDEPEDVKADEDADKPDDTEAYDKEDEPDDVEADDESDESDDTEAYDEDSEYEDDTDEKSGFTYDDFYEIDKEIDDEKKNKKGKKSGEKLALFALVWIVLFSAGVFAFLYFQTDLFKKKKATTTEQTTEEITTETEETTEELDDGFYTIYSYQTNADININALMADYYDALVKGDKDKLKDIVTEPEAFGDMMIYETKAQVISEYSNITCYTIPGLNEGEILVFTTSNVTISGVNSKPLDIKQFYVVKDGNNYKINNGVLSQETIDYINVQAGSPDVQALYKSVQDNINQCLAEDSTFADFYNKISTNTDAEAE